MNMDEELIREAIKGNIGYLDGYDLNDIALFFESVAEELYDDEKLAKVAEILRELETGAF
jgi:hypothetical protein